MARPNLQDYMKLIAQKAWSTWYKLPPQHRSWIDVEDLIQDGILYARFYVLPRFRPHRAKNFSTILFISLENFYKNKISDLFRGKRNKCQVVPVSSVQYHLGECDTTEQELKAVQGLLNVISVASPLLRGYLHRWLFAHGKVTCRGKKSIIAIDELRGLVGKCGIEREDFSYLLHSENWRKRLQPRQQKFLLSTSNPVK